VVHVSGLSARFLNDLTLSSWPRSGDGGWESLRRRGWSLLRVDPVPLVRGRAVRVAGVDHAIRLPAGIRRVTLRA
jgi:hypothetical protein